MLRGKRLFMASSHAAGSTSLMQHVLGLHGAIQAGASCRLFLLPPSCQLYP